MAEREDTWHLGRRPALDGVRGIAIGLVLFGHVVVWDRTQSAGSAGVTVFFVLSGFLITTLLLDEIRATGRVSLKAFYVRRARRLLPALALTVVAFLLLGPVFVPGYPIEFPWRSLIGAGTYSTNWLAIDHKTMGLAHLWSLAIEEQFYIVWPLLLVVLARLHRLLLVTLLVCGAFATLLWRNHLWATSDPLPFDRLYFGTDARADGLLLGCALAVFMQGRARRTAGPLWALLGLAWIALCTSLPVGYGMFVAMPWLVALGSVAVIYGAAQSGARWLEWRPLVLLGERSYALYLLQPVVGAAPIWILGIDNIWMRMFVMLPLSWFAASLSWRYIEQPFRRRRSGADQVHPESGVAGAERDGPGSQEDRQGHPVAHGHVDRR